MRSTSGHVFTSLTTEIGNKNSPLRQHFEARFPNRRQLQVEFEGSAGQLLVDSAGANPGWLGAAFDFMVRMILDPSHVPAVALQGIRPESRMLNAALDVVAVAQRAATRSREGHAADELIRACWLFALTTEVYRTGMRPGSPLMILGSRSSVSAELLLGLAPDVAVDEMQALHLLAAEHLYPRVPVGASLALVPTFAASELCNADADLIFDGCLLDIKTRLGDKTTRGRSDGVSLQDLYQLLGYVLFDRPDEFGIEQVGIYSARYAHLVTWPIDTFLATLAGQPVDLAAERELTWGLLQG